MKIYVASRLSNAKRAKEVIKELRELGHEITYDWTDHPIVDATDSLSTQARQKLAEIAVSETEGVKSADLLLVVFPAALGSHVEIGIALGLNKKVILCLEEKYADIKSFYFHPNVALVYNLETAIELFDY